MAMKKILAVFDPGSWELSFEAQGGILFFYVKKVSKS